MDYAICCALKNDSKMEKFPCSNSKANSAYFVVNPLVVGLNFSQKKAWRGLFKRITIIQASWVCDPLKRESRKTLRLTLDVDGLSVLFCAPQNRNKTRRKENVSTSV